MRFWPKNRITSIVFKSQMSQVWVENLKMKFKRHIVFIKLYFVKSNCYQKNTPKIILFKFHYRDGVVEVDSSLVKRNTEETIPLTKKSQV